MSKPLQDERIKKIRKGEPIEEQGLIFYPILVEDYDLFMMCHEALILRLSTLPVKYAIKDYLSALFALDYDNQNSEDKKYMGIFFRAIRMLYLALRIDFNVDVVSESIFYNKVNDEILISEIIVEQDQKKVSITPQVFSNVIRPLIAEQNGLILPDESENADLVRAYEQKNALNNQAQNLEISTEKLISSVAYQGHIREKDLYTYTVREFNALKDAIDRSFKYQIFQTAQMSGMVEFKKGNPYPSWCFDMKDEELGTKSIAEVGDMMRGHKSN